MEWLQEHVLGIVSLLLGVGVAHLVVTVSYIFHQRNRISMALAKSISTEKKLDAHAASPHVTQETIDHLNKAIEDNKEATEKVAEIQENNRLENKGEHDKIWKGVQASSRESRESFAKVNTILLEMARDK